MTIAIDASRAARAKRTGTEQASFFLLKALLALPEAKGHRFVLYTDVPLPADLFVRAGHIEERRVSSTRPWLLSFSRALWRERKQLDVLFVPSHVVPFFLPKRTVTMIHGMEWVHEPSSYTSAELRQQLFATRRALRTCATILTPSQATADDLRTWAATKHFSVPPTNVVLHGPPVLDFTLASSGLPERFAAHDIVLDDTQPFLLFIGRQDKRKNIVFLMRVFARAFPDLEPVKLVIAGGAGAATPELQQVHADLSPEVRARILFAGYVSEQEKAWFLTHARAFVYPSLAEGFGLPVLEAWQTGCPVVVSDLPVFREVAGDAAIYADPHSEEAFAAALKRVLQSDVREELLRKGKSRLAAFSWETSAQKTLRVLLESIER